MEKKENNEKKNCIEKNREKSFLIMELHRSYEQ
jgi:hypothetical protein